MSAKMNNKQARKTVQHQYYSALPLDMLIIIDDQMIDSCMRRQEVTYIKLLIC